MSDLSSTPPNPDQNNKNQNSTTVRSLPVIAGITIAAILAIGAGAYAYSRQSSNIETPRVPEVSSSSSISRSDPANLATPSIGAPFSSNSSSSTSNLSTSTSSSSTSMVINISMQNYSFSPASIKVKQGQKVTFEISNSGGLHDFVVRDLNIASQQITAGKTTRVETVIPNKPGTYRFICSVGNHEAMGMVGELTIE